MTHLRHRLPHFVATQHGWLSKGPAAIFAEGFGDPFFRQTINSGRPAATDCPVRPWRTLSCRRVMAGAFAPELGGERPETALVFAPAAHGIAVERPAHLGGARGADWAFGAVKLKAARVPVEAA